ncbi:phage tail protein [Providencia rettgeri]
MSVIKKPDLKIFAQDAKTGEVETFPDVLRGWGVTLDRTAGKPPLEWFNALGKRVDEWLMYLTQRGVAEWDTTLSYPKTAIVQFNSVVYVSIKETKGEQPDKSQASWSTLGVFLGLGNYYNKTESDTKFQPKGNYAPAGNYQPAGDYATNAALTNGLNQKLDKTGGDITGRVDVSSVITASQLTAKTPENSTVQLNPINSGPRIEHRTNGGTWYIHTLPNYSGTLMQIGDGGWMRDVGVPLGAYPKLSDYRINSIGYAYGNVSTDSFDGTNHFLLNLFGYSSNNYGAQLAITLAGKVGIRTIVNNVVNPWDSMFTSANTQRDHNGNVKIPGYLERSDYPVGCPIPWPQSTTPAGYLVCNGQSFNKTTYPLLAKAYPTGVLPDLRGEFLRGLDAGRGIDSGRAVLSAQGDAFRAHNHSVIGEDSGSGTAYFGRGNGSRREISKDAMNLEGGTETRPRNIAFLYIVRAA